MVKTGISLDSVKNNNKSQILKILQKNGAMSRKDIANQIGLTPAAVTMLCNDMMEAHMILEKGEMKEQKRAGRKKVLVDINYDFKYIVSVNIEAVDTSITVTNIRGNMLVEAKIHTRTDIEPQLFLEELAKEIKLQLWEKELKLSDILGIGICVPGIVDRNNGISIHAYGIWNNQVKIREILEKQIQCPVILENNVKAFAEAEMLYGVGKYGNNIVFIKWGPGVGSLFHADAHRRDCISVSCLPSFAVWTASGGGLPSLGAGRRQIRSVPVSGKLSSLGPYWPEVGAVWMGRPFLFERRNEFWLSQLW